MVQNHTDLKYTKKYNLGSHILFASKAKGKKNQHLKKFQMQWPSRKILLRDCLPLKKESFLIYLSWKSLKKTGMGKKEIFLKT